MSSWKLNVLVLYFDYPGFQFSSLRLRSSPLDLDSMDSRFMKTFNVFCELVICLFHFVHWCHVWLFWGLLKKGTSIYNWGKIIHFLAYLVLSCRSSWMIKSNICCSLKHLHSYWFSLNHDTSTYAYTVIQHFKKQHCSWVLCITNIHMHSLTFPQACHTFNLISDSCLNLTVVKL